MSILPPAAKGDPSARVVDCEGPGCLNSVRVGDSHSFIIVYATTGPAVPTDGGGAGRIPAFGCDAEQHFCCSHECAVAAGHACLDEHVAAGHAPRASVLAATGRAAPTGVEG